MSAGVSWQPDGQSPAKIGISTDNHNFDFILFFFENDPFI